MVSTGRASEWPCRQESSGINRKRKCILKEPSTNHFCYCYKPKMSIIPAPDGYVKLRPTATIFPQKCGRWHFGNAVGRENSAKPRPVDSILGPHRPLQIYYVNKTLQVFEERVKYTSEGLCVNRFCHYHQPKMSILPKSMCFWEWRIYPVFPFLLSCRMSDCVFSLCCHSRSRQLIIWRRQRGGVF